MFRKVILVPGLVVFMFFGSSCGGGFSGSSEDCPTPTFDVAEIDGKITYSADYTDKQGKQSYSASGDFAASGAALSYAYHVDTRCLSNENLVAYIESYVECDEMEGTIKMNAELAKGCTVDDKVPSDTCANPDSFKHLPVIKEVMSMACKADPLI